MLLWLLVFVCFCVLFKLCSSILFVSYCVVLYGLMVVRWFVLVCLRVIVHLFVRVTIAMHCVLLCELCLCVRVCVLVGFVLFKCVCAFCLRLLVGCCMICACCL